MSTTKRSTESTVRLAVPLVAFLVLQIASTAHTRGDGQEGRDRKDEPAATEPRLAALHGVIEKAFLRCDAKFLRTAMSPRVKTYVASSALGAPAGYYGADQTLLLFRRLFEGRTTMRFSVLTEGPRLRKDGQAVLPALWIYREEGIPRAEVRVSFVLALEGGQWRIREIRDLK